MTGTLHYLPSSEWPLCHALGEGDRLRLYPSAKCEQRWVIVAVAPSHTSALRIDDGRAGPDERYRWTHEWIAERLAAGEAFRERDGLSADLSALESA